MKSILGITQSELVQDGGIYTAREIDQQPELWSKVYSLIREQESEIRHFMDVAAERSGKIILTGAGTSAFIGLSLERDFQKHWGLPARAVATTDLVTHPEDYFNKKDKLILVSFGRSGNSPESCAAVYLADQLSGSVMHLIITCDPKGDLAINCTDSERFVLCLPEESNDRSLAMTSSYTGMLLAGLLISRIQSLKGEKERVEKLISYGNTILRDYSSRIKEVAGMAFTRSVFLGSGPQIGTATESQLKLQELTDGNIISKMDTFLGFRHGPKAVVNNETLVVNLFSNQSHALQYERDLVSGMKRGKPCLYRIGIFETEADKEFVGEEMDLAIVLSGNTDHLDEEYLSICNVIPAQLLGFYKSLELGLSPDKPSRSGAISRVVKGVRIYPYTDYDKNKIEGHETPVI
jgi:tagatose-6-phosphate ketose/aldose isomerase